MIKNRFFKYFLLAGLAVFAAAVSCKKDDDDSDTKLYLGGTLEYDFPGYVQYGQVIHVAPTGVYRPNSSDASDKTDTLLTWIWTNPFTEEADTLRRETDPDTVGKAFDFTVDLDTLGDFTMKVTVAATDYYSKVLSRAFTIVDPEPNTGSLRGFTKFNPAFRILDGRNQEEYYYMSDVAGVDLLLQNMAYGGVPYLEEPAVSMVFGHYYTYEEALGAWPAGWRLPTAAEFDAMAAEVGGDAGAMMEDVTFNGTEMWPYTREVKITNLGGFSAIPCGYATVEDGEYRFYGIQDYAVFWTADAKDGDTAYTRYMVAGQPSVFAGEHSRRDFCASVRCVR